MPYGLSGRALMNQVVSLTRNVPPLTLQLRIVKVAIADLAERPIMLDAIPKQLLNAIHPTLALAVQVIWIALIYQCHTVIQANVEFANQVAMKDAPL